MWVSVLKGLTHYIESQGKNYCYLYFILSVYRDVILNFPTIFEPELYADTKRILQTRDFDTKIRDV